MIGQRDTNELLTPVIQLPSTTSPAQRSGTRTPRTLPCPGPVKSYDSSYLTSYL